MGGGRRGRKGFRQSAQSALIYLFANTMTLASTELLVGSKDIRDAALAAPLPPLRVDVGGGGVRG